jgi:hypothetical protein
VETLELRARLRREFFYRQISATTDGMPALTSVEVSRGRFRPTHDDSTKESGLISGRAFLLHIRLKPFGIRGDGGGSSSVDRLQAGHGAPAAPQVQRADLPRAYPVGPRKPSRPLHRAGTSSDHLAGFTTFG